MGWDLLTAICTLLGGLAAGIAIYNFIEEIAHIRRSGPKPPGQQLPPAKSSLPLPISPAASYQDYVDFARLIHHDFGRDLWGKLVVYTRAPRLGQDVHVHGRAGWVQHNVIPDKRVPVKRYRNRANGHTIYAAVFDLPPDYYLVWIGKHRRRLFFTKPVSAPVFSGEVTELYLP